MRLFKEVVIVGPGLIGGSIALGLKRKKIAGRVTGISRRQRTIALAKKIKAIDRGSRDLRLSKDADLVVLAAPVDAILKIAERLKGIIRKDCIVIDVGSSKEKIVKKLQNLFPLYLGTHPLAGSQHQGIASASQDLFCGSLCVLTPTKKTHPRVLRIIEKFWRSLGARVVFLTPAYHDKAIAMVSHLPHSVAFALMAAIPGNYLKYGSSGLSDTTRIAGSDSALWADIFLSNRKNILGSIGIFQKNLFKIRTAINRGDRKALLKVLKAAQVKRNLYDNCH